MRYTTLCLTLSVCLMVASSFAGAEEPLYAYVGTFSSPLHDPLPTQVDLPEGNGRGIHIFRVDRSTGGLTAVGECRLGTSPSHVAINSAGTRLYTANETDHVGEQQHGTVSAFAIDRADGSLTKINTVSSGGAGPTYVSIHPSGRYLLVANYFGGSIAVVPILASGELGEPTDVQAATGNIGPTKATHAPEGSFAISGHDRTHAHMIETDPSGRFVVHVDLGQDRIYVWQLDLESGKLSPAEQPFVALPPGDGPRHFSFHSNGRWFYSIQEEGSTVTLFDFDSKSGSLTKRQTIASLAPGYAGSNFCSEILVSSDGKFLYAGNRLHDSISVFAIGEQGELEFVNYHWTRGDYPRSFAFEPSGQFLYSCNQRADNLAVFRVNRDTGELKFTEQYVPVGNPSCIVFLDFENVSQPSTNE
ncbi:lactonase family protein [Aeoliella mucimassa]|uniref:6-phosphogluconolactonase n=1 Tax=Aeoliella mucimassa TaxID=2527972 RepID=A0A518AQB8_9BACT|nr:lactonase family protein [Aeoliella mucimassa]QDU56914.1 6-phosphogluconolactonase [Aeoliella mucimassa]